VIAERIKSVCQDRPASRACYPGTAAQYATGSAGCAGPATITPRGDFPRCCASLCPGPAPPHRARRLSDLASGQLPRCPKKVSPSIFSRRSPSIRPQPAAADPERRVQVDRAGERVLRAFERVGRALARILQQLEFCLGHSKLVIIVHVAAIEFLLVDRLPRPAFAHLRRPVGRQHKQRHAALVRLDDRGQETAAAVPEVQRSAVGRWCAGRAQAQKSPPIVRPAPESPRYPDAAQMRTSAASSASPGRGSRGAIPAAPAFHDGAAPEAVRVAEVESGAGHLRLIENDSAQLASFSCACFLSIRTPPVASPDASRSSTAPVSNRGAGPRPALLCPPSDVFRHLKLHVLPQPVVAGVFALAVLAGLAAGCAHARPTCRSSETIHGGLSIPDRARPVRWRRPDGGSVLFRRRQPGGAFSYGVLRELAATRLANDRRMLDEVTTINAVSAEASPRLLLL